MDWIDWTILIVGSLAVAILAAAFIWVGRKARKSVLPQEEDYGRFADFSESEVPLEPEELPPPVEEVIETVTVEQAREVTAVAEGQPRKTFKDYAVPFFSACLKLYRWRGFPVLLFLVATTAFYFIGVNNWKTTFRSVIWTLFLTCVLMVLAVIALVQMSAFRKVAPAATKQAVAARQPAAGERHIPQRGRQAFRYEKENSNVQERGDK